MDCLSGGGGFTEGGVDPGNYATYDGDGGTSPGIGEPYYRTNKGEWENSASPYGTFDQGGNVWEWNEAEIGSYRGLRGGSFYLVHDNLRAAFHESSDPAYGSYSVGFRVAKVSDLAIPTLSEWAVVSMTLLLLTAGTIVYGRVRPTAIV